MIHLVYSLYDKYDRLLYVGYSFVSIRNCNKEGALVTRVALQYYETEAEAIDAERIEILTLQPLYNVHNNVTVRSAKRRHPVR